MNDVIQLINRYSQGERDFTKIQLKQLNLENIFLCRANLSQANIDRANLKNADLSDVDLTASFLVEVDLSNAHLSRANLRNTNSARANFSLAVLTRANFNHACLDSANFESAVLIEADFSNASLLGANLSKTDLSHANFVGALYNSQTNFPSNFDPASKGMINQSTVRELLAKLNSLCQHSSKYLGNVMTTKYLVSSRPKSEWLQQFTIDQDCQIVFSENLDIISTAKELQLFQKWQNSFIKSCSVIVKDFKNMV